MAFTPTVLITALVAILFFTCVGQAVARRLRPAWSPGAGVAPALGWAVFTAPSFFLQSLLGFSRVSTTVLAVVAVLISLAAARRAPRIETGAGRLPVWSFALAALLALLPLVGLLPKPVPGGVILGPTSFDHAKIAIVDEITRLGLPAGDPFFGAAGARSTLPYYYLWHFGAAQVSSVLHVSGWEADAAMTGVTAYASMLLMMGLAVGLARAPQRTRKPGIKVMRLETCGTIAVAWVALLSLTGSLRPLLLWLLGPAGMDGLLSPYRGLAGWMVQASWVPQHLASACCVVLAVLVLADLATAPRPAKVLLLGVLAAAAFGSSAWIGGVTFAIVAAGVGLAGLIYAPKAQRLKFLVAAAAGAVIAVLLAFPLLRAEFASLGGRHGTAPVVWHPYEVVGTFAPAHLRRALDLPAYWLLLLPIELPPIYVIGGIGLVIATVGAIRHRGGAPTTVSLAVLAVLSLGVSAVLVSTIGNNDLGWRAMLPAVLVLTAFAASALARWIAARAYAGVSAGLVLALASIPDRQALANLRGRMTDNAPDFAAGPAMWAQVRRYAGPADRVADNPLYLDDMTDWPVNPSWAMLSNRASCYSGWETARAYVNLPPDQLKALDDQFVRVFAGRGSPEDVRRMAQDYGCRVVVLTETDPAWTQDPFAASRYYRLAQQRDDQWRIYVATGDGGGR